MPGGGDNPDYAELGDAAALPETLNANMLLLNAVGTGNIAEVRALIARKADVNCTNIANNTPLMTAAKGGYLEIVEALLAAGADPNKPNFSDETPIMEAARAGHTAIMDRLIKAGAGLDAATKDGGETALIFAVMYYRLEAAELLIASGAKLDIQDKRLNTALMWAAWTGNPEMTELLVNAGADLNLANISGETAMTTASLNEKPVVAELLEAAARKRAAGAKAAAVGVGTKGKMQDHINGINDALLRMGAPEGEPRAGQKKTKSTSGVQG